MITKVKTVFVGAKIFSKKEICNLPLELAADMWF